MRRSGALTLETLGFAAVKQYGSLRRWKVSGCRIGLSALNGFSSPTASYAFDDFRNLVFDACLLNEVARDYYVRARRCRG